MKEYIKKSFSYTLGIMFGIQTWIFINNKLLGSNKKGE